MNKITSVNLGGKAYQMETDGYDALRNYLSDAASHLAGNPDGAEIIKDLEQAIAEKANRFIHVHKDVLTTAEIQTILAEMGPVTNEHRTASDTSAPAPKKLYLITEGAIIGGVANGVAAYLQVGVTVIRLLFILLTIITGGGFVLAYILGMIVIPQAKTAEQVAAARGLPFNAQELVNRARAGYEKIAKDGIHRSWPWRK